MTETLTIRNGIDVDQLLATIEAIKADPAVRTFALRASSQWLDGTHNAGEIGHFAHGGQEDTSRDEAFRLEGDEPPALLGQTRGPNAVELLLQALGICYAVGLWPTPRPAASGSPRRSTRSRVILTHAHFWDWTDRGPGSPRSE